MTFLVNPHHGAPSTARSYWRLYVTEVGAEGYAAVREIEFAEINGPKHTGGTAINSSNLGSSVDQHKAFDGDWNTRWESGHGMPEWIGQSFPVPVDVSVVRVYDYSGQRWMKDFTVQSSIDGVTWDDHWTVLDHPYSHGKLAFPDPTLPKSLIRLLSTWGDFSAIAEIEWATSAGGADVGVRAWWSGTGYTDGFANEVMDNNNSTFWFMNPNGWLVMEPTVPWDDLYEFRMRVSSSDLRMMRSFKIQTTSDGGATWNDEKVVTGEPAWSSSERRTWVL